MENIRKDVEKQKAKSVNEILRHIDEICEKLFQLDLVQKDIVSWVKEQKKHLEVELRKYELALDEIRLEVDFSMARSLPEKKREALR